MKLVITNLWTKKVACYSIVSKMTHIALQRKLEKYMRNLPNTYTRHKRCRQNCMNVDRAMQKLTGLDRVYLSMYTGKFFKVEIQDK